MRCLIIRAINFVFNPDINITSSGICRSLDNDCAKQNNIESPADHQTFK